MITQLFAHLSPFAIILAQTDPRESTPIWLPLLLIIIMLLLLWWGLTRNNVVETAVHDDHSDHHDDGHHDDGQHDDGQHDTHAEPAAKSIGHIVTDQDDLKKVEGIGPVIEKALHAGGITTFAQLAATSVEDLERIVKTEGKVRIAFPESWPAQAALAAAGNWDGLFALQEELNAGR